MPRYKRPMTDEEMRSLKDEDIDLSDIPELTEDWFKRARIVWPAKSKDHLSLRLDSDIVDWFKAQGRGYQTRINAVLRAYVEAQAKSTKSKPASKR